MVGLGLQLPNIIPFLIKVFVFRRPTHIHTNGSIDKGIVNPAADDIDLDDPTMGGRYADEHSKS